MGEVGADPTTPEEADLQSAAVADLLLPRVWQFSDSDGTTDKTHAPVLTPEQLLQADGVISLTAGTHNFILYSCL